jgi:hypothetical protein
MFGQDVTYGAKEFRAQILMLSLLFGFTLLVLLATIGVDEVLFSVFGRR